jgi:hypothetical protein
VVATLATFIFGQALVDKEAVKAAKVDPAVLADVPPGNAPSMK